MKRYYSLCMATTALLLLHSSCNKNVTQNDEANEKIITSEMVFSPSTTVTYEGDCLSFSSYEALDSFIDEVNNSNPYSVKSWEISLGFESQKRLFNDVVHAEDSINTLFESGVLTGDQIYSEAFTRAQDFNIIDYVTDLDGSTYWTTTTKFEYYSPALNKDGLIKVAGKLHKFYNDGVLKVAKEFDFVATDFDVNLVSNDNIDVFEGYYGQGTSVPEVTRNITNPQCNTIGGVLGHDYYKTINNWQQPAGNKRVKIELEWKSVKNFGQQDCDRFYGISIQFYFYTHAQKKNFWGKWVYNNYYPNFTFHVDKRRYGYSTNMSCLGRTLYRNELHLPVFNNAPRPGQSYSVNTNKGVFPINPSKSGWYVFDNSTTERFICPAFLSEYSFRVNYDGTTNWGFQ